MEKEEGPLAKKPGRNSSSRRKLKEHSQNPTDDSSSTVPSFNFKHKTGKEEGPLVKKPKRNSSSRQQLKKYSQNPTDHSSSIAPRYSSIHPPPYSIPSLSLSPPISSLSPLSSYIPHRPPISSSLSSSKFERILIMALKRGRVSVKVLKCLLQGPGRVGKTHLKSLLLQQKVSESVLCSTGCAEHPERAIRNVNADRFGVMQEKWELMNDHMLASLITLVTQQLSSFDEDEEIEKEEDGDKDEEDGDEEEMSNSITEQSSIPDDTPLPKEGAVGSVLLTVKEINLEQDIEQSGCVRSIPDSMLYFIDSGGQPQFQEVLQAFIPDTAMLLLAFKLTEKLSDIPQMQFQSAESSYTLGRYAISNEEIISRFARMVFSSANKDVQIALIGTYRDQYSETEHEAIEQKDSQLLSLFSFCQDHLLYLHAAKGSLLFPVNGKLAQEGIFTESDDAVRRLRSEIASTLEKMSPVEIPLRWYALELGLNKFATETGRRVLSMDECMKMSSDLKFSPEDVPYALRFLNKYNLILYYESILPNVVFTTPQVLLDKVTELTECVYSFSSSSVEGTQSSASSSHSLSQPQRGEYLTMRDKGIISLKILQDHSKHYVPGLFSEKEVLLIFEHLYITADLGGGRSFMPSLLPHFTLEELAKLYEDPSKPPLLFHFEGSCVPAGLFCALLVCLTSSGIGWKIEHKLKPLKGVYSNAAHLSVPGIRFQIALADAFSQLEVHYRCPIGKEKHLPMVREVISEGLEEVIYNRKFNIALPKRLFFCRANDHPSEDTSPMHRHFAVPNREEKELVCTIDSLAGSEMNEVELKWLEPAVSHSGGDTTAGCPTIAQLTTELKEVSPKWDQFGLQLKVPDWKLEAISKEKDSCLDQLTATLVYWRRNTNADINPFKWETVTDALKKIEYNGLAEDIKKKYIDS